MENNDNDVTAIAISSVDSTDNTGNSVKGTDEIHADGVMRRRTTKLTRGVATLYVFLIGTLDSIGSAMPLWWFAAVTLGFGAIFGFPVPFIIYIILGVQNKSVYLLEICGNTVYVLMRIFGFIAGQLAGFGLFMFLPLMTLAPDSASGWMVLLAYVICMITALVCARMLQKFAEK